LLIEKKIKFIAKNVSLFSKLTTTRHGTPFFRRELLMNFVFVNPFDHVVVGVGFGQQNSPTAHHV